MEEKTANKKAKKVKTSKPKFNSGQKKVPLVSIKGKTMKKTIKLPVAFDHEFRPMLIRNVVTAHRANRRQPYGATKMAGMTHAVSTWGKGRGVARVQRLTQGRVAAESPPNVGGRRAHPPKPEKVWKKKVNKKERKKALLSALAATTNVHLVKARGHKFEESVTLPVVFPNQLEKIEKTRALFDLLSAIGLGADLERAQSGKHIRAGRGTMRGRKYKQPKSILIVVGDDREASILRSARNLPGVDICMVSQLNTEHLAPGGEAGRLTVFSQNAIQYIGGW